jgi:hypothetical protein
MGKRTIDLKTEAYAFHAKATASVINFFITKTISFEDNG